MSSPNHPAGSPEAAALLKELDRLEPPEAPGPEGAEQRQAREKDTAYFDADIVAAPLRARAPRPGDRMRPFGLAGRKKLSDLFVDRKVPRRVLRGQAFRRHRRSRNRSRAGGRCYR